MDFTPGLIKVRGEAIQGGPQTWSPVLPTQHVGLPQGPASLKGRSNAGPSLWLPHRRVLCAQARDWELVQEAAGGPPAQCGGGRFENFSSPVASLSGHADPTHPPVPWVFPFVASRGCKVVACTLVCFPHIVLFQRGGYVKTDFRFLGKRIPSILF